MFSRLLDANFDAMHGSFASILRLLDVFGEFFYVVRTFAAVGALSKLANWLIGRNSVQKRRIENPSGAPLLTNSQSPIINLNDISNFEQNKKKKKFMPFAVMILGITCIGLPLFLTRLVKKLSERRTQAEDLGKLDNLWSGNGETESQSELAQPITSNSDDSPFMVRANSDFRAEGQMEISFRRNDVFKVTGKPFAQWWEGEIEGQRGLFPSNLVTPVDGTTDRQDSRQESWMYNRTNKVF